MESVLDLIKKSEVVALTQELVRIKSYLGVEGVETELAEYIAKFLQDNGMGAKLQEVFAGRCNVLGSLTDFKQVSGKRLLLCGHMDTVSPEQMEIEPFTAYLKDGKLWGRGSVDMKGGLAAMLIAMKAVHQAGIKLTGDVLFAGVVGEESPNTSEGARYLADQEKIADMAIIGEATKLGIAVAHKGMTWFKITVVGKAAHGSMPEAGINAIVYAAKIIEKINNSLIPKLAMREHHFVGKPTLNIGKIEGGMQNNIVPANCWFSLDRRWIPGETIEGLQLELEEIIRNLQQDYPELQATVIEMPETQGRAPMEIDVKHQLVEVLKAAVGEVCSTNPPLIGVVYWTDGAHLAASGIPTVVFGPGDIHEAHAAVEFVDTEDLYQAALVYAKVILEICQ
ncbi:MAG: M20 family metallopeptidase [Clostridia bacterium]